MLASSLVYLGVVVVVVVVEDIRNIFSVFLLLPRETSPPLVHHVFAHVRLDTSAAHAQPKIDGPGGSNQHLIALLNLGSR